MIQETISETIKVLETLSRELTTLHGFLSGPIEEEEEEVFRGHTVTVTKGLAKHGKTTAVKPKTKGKAWPRPSRGERNHIARRVQELLKDIVDKQPGITRKEIQAQMRVRLPSNIKGDVNPTNNRSKWEDCLSNMMRNYEVAGYLKRIRRGDTRTDTANDEYFLGA